MSKGVSVQYGEGDAVLSYARPEPGTGPVSVAVAMGLMAIHVLVGTAIAIAGLLTMGGVKGWPDTLLFGIACMAYGMAMMFVGFRLTDEGPVGWPAVVWWEGMFCVPGILGWGLGVLLCASMSRAPVATIGVWLVGAAAVGLALPAATLVYVARKAEGTLGRRARRITVWVVGGVVTATVGCGLLGLAFHR